MTDPLWRLVVALGAIALAALACMWRPCRTFRFTLLIAGGVAAAMICPRMFLHWGSFDPRNRWALLLLLQAVMFGMGAQMTLADFAGLAQAPRGVLVGLVCHFSVMPLTGLFLARLFRFPPEIAAGVVLVGSCSSGLASNVMAYFARSNLALSVTVTALSTAASPFLTPLLMKLLAGTLVRVDVPQLMLEIVRIVIVPIGAALLHDCLRRVSPRLKRGVEWAAVVSAAWLAFLLFGGWARLAADLPHGMLVAVGMCGYVAELLVVGVLYHRASRRAWVVRAMPVLSMAGIIYVTTVTTAAGRANLVDIGVVLVICSMLHNFAGYTFGYWLARLARLDRNSARSVAFEVGLQNAGMATGLAAAMGKLATVGLAPAMFSAWMNISGSLLANFWRRHPVADRQPAAPVAEPIAPT